MFEAMGCFYHYCPCQETRPVLIEAVILRRTKKKETDEMRRQYIEAKGYTVVKRCKCDWWDLYNTDILVEEHFRKSFLYKYPLRQDQLKDKTKSSLLFDYVQCNIKVPEHLKEKFANFASFLKNKNACRQDICPFFKEYAGKERLMCQPRRMLISSFKLTTGTIITPLHLFYMALGLACTKN